MILIEVNIVKTYKFQNRSIQNYKYIDLKTTYKTRCIKSLRCYKNQS